MVRTIVVEVGLMSRGPITIPGHSAIVEKRAVPASRTSRSASRFDRV